MTIGEFVVVILGSLTHSFSLLVSSFVNIIQLDRLAIHLLILSQFDDSFLLFHVRYASKNDGVSMDDHSFA